MSRYSLDSLDNDSSLDDKLASNFAKDCNVTLMCNDLEDIGKHGECNEPLFWYRRSHDYIDTDARCNESPQAGLTIQPESPTKSRGSASIASTVNAVGKSCLTDAGCNESPESGVTMQSESPKKSRGNALIASTVNGVGKSLVTGEEKRATSNFRVGRPVAKKLDVARRSLSSTAEFRLRVSPLAGGKSPSTEGIEGFMKAGKKPGKACRTIVDKGKKKHVSYLELHRRKFGVESSRCISTPEGPTLSVLGDRMDQRLVDVDEGTSITVSRDDESELGFYRRVMELGSQEARESRSCEDLERFDPDEGVSKSSGDAFECSTNSAEPTKLRRQIVYQPYSVEDYKCLSVPQADRSLGPDRIAMESKGEWLMRRRSYGDSVSARNRQRILRHTQKLKESRRADVQKPRLAPLTDVENPVPVSKVQNDKQQGSDSVGQTKSFSNIVRKEKNRRASRIGKLVEGKSGSLKSNPEPKDSSSFLDFYETSSDTTEESRNLKNLQLRYQEEKKKIDRLFNRGFCA